MSQLTTRQRQIVEFVRHSQERTGIAPTQQEIADHFDFRSTNAVRQHLRLIRQKGMLEPGGGKARSLKVVSPLQRL